MSVSVRTRFEVFKRDRFTCSYCGRTPPEVLLECDHIVPRAAGGSDDIANLTTACATCNRGKSARLLEEGTAPVVGRATIEELAERVEQAKAYMDLLGGLQSVTDRQVAMVQEAWARTFKAGVIERDGQTYWQFENVYGEVWPNEHSVRRFLRHLTLNDVLEAIDIAASKMLGSPGTAATRYFYGVCQRAIKEGRPVGDPYRGPASIEGELAEARVLAREEERRYIHDLLLNHENYGYETLNDALLALWPEDE